MNMIEFLEWLEDVIFGGVEDWRIGEKGKATIWPIDDGIMVDFDGKGLFQISVKQIDEDKEVIK
jgi:hypothetical protein